MDQYPISSVINMLEKQQWDVFELPTSFGQSGIAGYDTVSMAPFVYCTTQAGIVNLRMQLLQTIATAYFRPDFSAEDTEELNNAIAQRFAGSMLFTHAQAVQEFGEHRTAVTSSELTLVKQKYGLPKYEIMRRLLQLGIIERPLFRAYMSEIRQMGYPGFRDTMREPLFFYENSSEYKRKVQYAYAQGLID